MPGPLVAGIAGSLGAAAIQSSAAKKAAGQQAEATDAQIAETRRQFDTVTRLLSPYAEAGTVGLRNQMALMGIGGQAFAPRVRTIMQDGVETFKVAGKSFDTIEEARSYADNNRVGGMTPREAQQQAINKIKRGSQFQELARQGEYGIMSNAAATGGLRGGDVQGALSQFRPALLQGLIDRQLANFGGLAANGQSAASRTAVSAQDAGSQINAALGDRGAALSGGTLAAAEGWANAGSGILQTLGGLAQPVTPGGGAFQKWSF